MKTAYSLLIVITIIGLGSCNELERKIKGYWAIERIVFEDNDILYEFRSNDLAFKEKFICKVPRLTSEEKDSTANWKLNKSDSLLVINCKNELIKGVYKISFFKDYDNKLLKMKLKNEKTTIIASKFFYNFDKDKTEIAP